MWTSKPVWLEAMFIRPQHFQQADRHAAWHIDVKEMHFSIDRAGAVGAE